MAIEHGASLAAERQRPGAARTLRPDGVGEGGERHESGDLSTDALQLFLKDIGKVELLTAAQEVELAKRIERGDHWWIRQAVARALADQARTIRMPVHVVEKLNKLGWAERTLHTTLGRPATAAEIAHETDLGADEVEQLRRSREMPVSLGQSVGDEDGAELGDLLTDANASLPDEETELILRDENLHRILGQLSTRQRQILELRYGLAGQEPQTLDEVGRIFNLTRERIRQIENQSLNILRQLAISQKFGLEAYA